MLYEVITSMNIIGATVRYPVEGTKRSEQSTVVQTVRTHNGDMALQLENGSIITEPPFVLVRVAA